MATSILDDVESPGEYDESGKYDVAYYGAGGSGKTTLLRTAKGRGLNLYTPQKEGISGKMVLKRWGDRIKVKTITDFDQYRPIYEALRDENPKRPPDKRYDWVAFDSITGGVQLAIKKILDRRTRKVRGARIKITGDEWGAIATLIDDELVQPFKSLPISTIWIGQEKDRRKRKHGKIMPDVTPGTLGAIQPAVLFLGRMYVMQDEEGNPERWMRIGPVDSIAAKYRAADPRLYVPQIIKEPNIDRLVRFLYAEAGTACPFEEAVDIEEAEDAEEDEYEEVKPKSPKAEEDEDLETEDEDEDE